MANNITSRWETIDPERAAKYIESMDGNRTVRQARVDYYAAQMVAGLWREIPQGISFDSDGHMIDGQHRMWAIIESKCAVVMMVSRGVNPEDVPAFDNGIVRTYADVGHFAGWENADPVAGSIAKMIVLGAGNVSRIIPPEVVQGWYIFYQSGCDFGAKVRNMTRGVGTKVVPYAVATAFARASYSLDNVRLMRAAEILKTGVIEADVERSIITLRDAWMTKRLGVNHLEQYQKASAALRAFDERRPIKTMQRAEKEIFPVPRLPLESRYVQPDKRHTRVRKAKAAATA